MTQRSTGKAALVTGAASGIGRATALALAQGCGTPLVGLEDSTHPTRTNTGQTIR
jgi:NAD(P)-dependent dehydrogenase (short-subunit alcohol dehydrogenase family)